MANVFIKKVWGYHPPTWPVLGFGKDAGANKLSREYQTGDLVVLVGTQNSPTPKDEQGRLLGLIQITNNKLDYLEELLRDLGTELDHHCYNKDDSFKWPVGFPFLEAYRLNGHPLLYEALPDHDPNNARAEAAYGMLLDPDSAQRILALPKTVEAFPFSSKLDKDIKLKEMLTRPGPVPAPGTRESEYEDGENTVYIFQLPRERFYKVGRSNDIQRRLNGFNTSPHAKFLGAPLEILCAQDLPDARTAHQVEQTIHAKLAKYSVGNECYKGVKEEVMKTIIANAMVETAEVEVEI